MKCYNLLISHRR